MPEWSTYRLEDLLLFSTRAYWRLFELHNASLRPLPILAFVLGLAGLALVVAGRGRHGRWLALGLAAAWASVGWSFVLGRYATINWAAVYVAPLFGVQALLLAVAAAGGLAFVRHGIARVAGLMLAAFAVLGYPLLSPLAGRPWSGAEVIAIAPDPTAIGTLGLLLLARPRLRQWLWPIPLLWCFVSCLTLAAMGEAQAVVPFAAAVLASGAWVGQAWRRQGQT
jgi:hypothetical protein